MAGSQDHNKDTQVPFRRLQDEATTPTAENNLIIDDFFDTSQNNRASNNDNATTKSNKTASSSSQHHHYYSPPVDRFVFDGEEEAHVIISPASPTSPYSFSTSTQPTFTHTTANVNDNCHYYFNGDVHDADGPSSQPLLLDNDAGSDDYRRLRLPSFDSRQLDQQQRRRRRRRPYMPDLSGLNILNLATFVVLLTVSILLESGVVDNALERHHRHRSWLPSTWDVTTMPQYETLLTPALWAGHYLWIPSLALEGLFSVVQLLPAVRTRPEVTSGVGFFWFYIGLLQSITTLFFCLEWIIPAWIALAANVVCLVLLQFQQQSANTSSAATAAPPTYTIRSLVTQWEYWIFRFPFDVHLGWLLPLLASRGSMVFRYYGNHDMGLQLAADIVAMALLLPCAGAYIVRVQGPPDWVIPLLIMWSYIGIAYRLLHVPGALVEAYGEDIVVAVRDAAWCFASTVGLLVVPSIVVWVAREFLTIQVVQFTADDPEEDEEVQDLVINDPSEVAAMSTTDF